MMFVPFTDRMRKVMSLANQEAQRFNHEFIGMEHILLGLLKVGSGKAIEIFKHFNVDIRKLCLEVETLVKAGCGPDEVAAGKLPQTPVVKKVLAHAMEECHSLKQSNMGTGHILLGLLSVKEGVAAQVLTDLGLTIENVRQEMLNLQEDRGFKT